jgi:hypothetical protein
MMSLVETAPSVGDLIWASSTSSSAAGDAPRAPWTTAQEKRLRAAWAEGGLAAAVDALPERTTAALYQRAQRLGLTGKGPRRDRGSFRQRWEATPVIDEAIRRAYQAVKAGRSRATAVAVARAYGRPAWWVRRRADQLGLSVPRDRGKDWSAAEDQILREAEGTPIPRIAASLTRAGFKRTTAAVRVRMTRLKLSTAAEDPQVMSALQLGLVLGVDSRTVGRWIEKGWLAARAIGEGEARQHWRIHRKAARAFVFARPEAVDLRKVEKFGFLDLLGGGA